MRICFDLDNTIAQVKRPDQSYADVLPLQGAAKKLKSLKKSGHYIIIHTARHMVTCKGDVNLVIERIGSITRSWLNHHDIPFDELIFGKPYADLYVDDKALKFTGDWGSLLI